MKSGWGWGKTKAPEMQVGSPGCLDVCIHTPYGAVYCCSLLRTFLYSFCPPGRQLGGRASDL